MKICVIGLGYVGLPTAALAAGAGQTVLGYDNNPDVREALRAARTTGSAADVAELLGGEVEVGDRVRGGHLGADPRRAHRDHRVGEADDVEAALDELAAELAAAADNEAHA